MTRKRKISNLGGTINNKKPRKNKKCQEETCNKIPIFNYQDETKGIYCGDHKLKDMMDVVNIKCLENGCNKRPNYNFQDEKKGIFCGKHKKENMVNVVDKKCLEETCNKHPTFNFPDEKRGRFCGDHKKETMVNVKNRKCQEKGCDKIPAFNYLDETKGILCAIHKLNDMVNVVSKKCEMDGCNTIANFNYPGNKIGDYCVVHKLNDMVDVKNKKCVENGCETRVSNDQYRGYCLTCFIFHFPNEKISKNYRIKEKLVVDYIKEQFNEYTWIFDKVIQGGCSKKRPDAFLDIGSHVIIIEIDENAHEDYQVICENRRIMELSLDLSNRPIVFIRFNPDSYTRNGKKFPSSFKLNSSGKVILRDNKEWDNRLSKLKDSIIYWINSEAKKMIEIEYLFYTEM